LILFKYLSQYITCILTINQLIVLLILQVTYFLCVVFNRFFKDLHILSADDFLFAFGATKNICTSVYF